MKKAALILGITSALWLPARADVLALWTFETTAPVTAGPFSPETGSGSALGSHSVTPGYSSPAGNGSPHSFSSNNWNPNDYYQFSTSTVGFTGVTLSYDQTSSGTGPGHFSLSYSTDGSSFTPFVSDYTVLGNGTSPNPSWNATTPSSAYSYTIDLSSITGLNNQASVFFRVTDISTVSAAGGTVGTGGTDRIDNFLINAAPVPEPTSLFLVGGLGVLAYSFIRRRG